MEATSSRAFAVTCDGHETSRSVQGSGVWVEGLQFGGLGIGLCCSQFVFQPLELWGLQDFGCWVSV